MGRVNTYDLQMQEVPCNQMDGISVYSDTLLRGCGATHQFTLAVYEKKLG